MSASAPPLSLAWQIEGFVPGIWTAFFTRVIPAVTAQSRVSSWWRGPEHNSRVGGSPDSQHLIGLALDLTDPDLGGLTNRLNTSGLVAIRYSGHTHVQVWPAGTARSTGLLAAVGL